MKKRLDGVWVISINSFFHGTCSADLLNYGVLGVYYPAEHVQFTKMKNIWLFAAVRKNCIKKGWSDQNLSYPEYFFFIRNLKLLFLALLDALLVQLACMTYKYENRIKKSQSYQKLQYSKDNTS